MKEHVAQDQVSDAGESSDLHSPQAHTVCTLFKLPFYAGDSCLVEPLCDPNKVQSWFGKTPRSVVTPLTSLTCSHYCNKLHAAVVAQNSTDYGTAGDFGASFMGAGQPPIVLKL